MGGGVCTLSSFARWVEGGHRFVGIRCRAPSVSVAGGMAGARACVWFVDAGVTGSSPTRRGRRQG